LSRSSGPGRARTNAPREEHRSSNIAARLPGRAGLLAGALAASALLLAAERSTLFSLHVAGRRAALETVSAGRHDGFALVPIALLAAVLAIGVCRAGSRPALLALGLLGAVAIAIALLADLPDARASGLVGSASASRPAAATPGPALYLETAGAALLILTSVCGLILAGAPRRVSEPARDATRFRRQRP
jgi:hypothetical protein